MTLKIRLACLVVLVFATLLYAHTGIHPADWTAVNSVTLQTSGKTLFVEFTEVSRSMRISAMDFRVKFTELQKDAASYDKPLVSLL